MLSAACRTPTGAERSCEQVWGQILCVTDLRVAEGSSEMELALEKSLDLLLRPRADMWWLRKERLLVVETQHSRETARERETERERGRETPVIISETVNQHHPKEEQNQNQTDMQRAQSVPLMELELLANNYFYPLVSL